MMNNVFLTLFKFYALITIIKVESLPTYDINKDELDASYWNKLSDDSIRRSLKQQIINKKAKNVILFLGDGMSISTITSSRILKGQLKNKTGEESILTFEKFPYVSLIKTYNVDYQVPDSAGTATAYLCGVKTNSGTLGVSARIPRFHPNCDEVLQNKVTSILKWAIDSGKSAGIVTTTRITDATPGAGYAHSADRYWESSLPSYTYGKCKDIAAQLIEEEPGSQLKVILGGGRRNFLPTTETDPSGKKGYRTDNRNLIKEWLNKKHECGLMQSSYAFVNSSGMLNRIDFEKTEYLFGLFNWDDMAYDKERDTSDNGEPSLEKMTDAAIKILRKDDNGFVLLVEGGRIDHAHHDNIALMALHETLAFEKAIQRAVDILPTDETLIVVTADHSHTLTINGKPKRGNAISGIAQNDSNNVPYTTLLYGNGPGFQSNRTDPSTVDTGNLRYRQLSAVHLIESKHGGEDVALHSIGPMAHLFQGTQEQSYIAHVMAFAACIGEYQKEDHCNCTKSSSNDCGLQFNKALFGFILFLMIIKRL